MPGVAACTFPTLKKTVTLDAHASCSSITAVLLVPLGAGTAHVVQLRAVGIEDRDL